MRPSNGEPGNGCVMQKSLSFVLCRNSVLLMMPFFCVLHSTSAELEGDDVSRGAQVKLIEAYLSATSPLERFKATNRLLPIIGEIDESIPLDGENTSFALLWQWERRVVIPVVQDVQKSNSPPRLLDVPKGATERFVGFVEGRLGHSVPRAWATAISGVQLTGPTFSPYFGDIHRFYDAAEIKSTEQGTVTAKVIQEVSTNGADPKSVQVTIIYNGNQKQVRCETQADSINGIAAAVNDDSIVVAFYSWFSGSGKVQCFDFETGQHRWTQDLWGGSHGEGGELGFPGGAVVVLSVDRERCLAYGVCNRGCFVEEYSLESGDPAVRFLSPLEIYDKMAPGGGGAFSK